MNRKSLLFGILLFVSVAAIAIWIQLFSELHYPKFGIFIGANPSDTLSFAGYDVIVIDAAFYTKSEVEVLKIKNKKVYSYLNIGSIETDTRHYPRFQNASLGPYANWPNEEWVDVSNKDWQKYILEYATTEIVSKGVDGFWINNTDVYYFYPTKAVFEGIIDIINRLNVFNLDLVINGGNKFVEEAILDSTTPKCRINGVNQEFVFTSYDFTKMKPIPPENWEKEYYLKYLNRVSKMGLAVYITEYEDFSVEKELVDYCKRRKWKFFLSPSLNLDTEPRRK